LWPALSLREKGERGGEGEGGKKPYSFKPYYFAEGGEGMKAATERKRGERVLLLHWRKKGLINRREGKGRKVQFGGGGGKGVSPF